MKDSPRKLGQMPFSVSTVTAFAKDLVSLAAAAGIVSYGAMTVLDIPTGGEIDDKIAGVEERAGVAREKIESDVRTHLNWNRAVMSRLSIMVNCLLYEVPAEQCQIPEEPQLEDYRVE